MHYCRRLFHQCLVIGVGLQAILDPLIASPQVARDHSLSLPPLLLDKLETRLIEGMDRGIQGDYLGAIAIFSELIQRYPNYADAYFNRGIARAKLQDYQGAIADQNQAITLNPQDAEAYQARAKVHWQLGNTNQAIADLQTAITLFTEHNNAISRGEATTLLQRWLGPE